MREGYKEKERKEIGKRKMKKREKNNDNGIPKKKRGFLLAKRVRSEQWSVKYA